MIKCIGRFKVQVQVLTFGILVDLSNYKPKLHLIPVMANGKKAIGDNG